MTKSKLHFSDIRYNPEISGFQARAAIRENGVTYVYPVHVKAALTADFRLITSQLSEKARHMHADRQNSLHMYHRAEPISPRPWAA